MMRSKIYSAGLVAKKLWFYENKQYIEMLNQGYSDEDIKEMSSKNNVFGAISSSRAKEIYSTTKRRSNVLGKEMQEIFQNLNIDNQKLLIFISVLLLNDLMLEFMLEVFQNKVGKGVFQLTTTDYKTFFSEKQRTNEIVAKWKPYTYSRLGGAYKNYLIEVGLIREEKGNDIITPKVLDDRIINWLKRQDRIDIVLAITGGM